MFDRKLTLNDLHLKENQVKVLKALGSFQRQALYDLCQHVYLTAYTKEGRMAAKNLREHVMNVTQSKDNRCLFDKKLPEKIKDFALGNG